MRKSRGLERTDYFKATVRGAETKVGKGNPMM